MALSEKVEDVDEVDEVEEERSTVSVRSRCERRIKKKKRKERERERESFGGSEWLLPRFN